MIMDESVGRITPQSVEEQRRPRGRRDRRARGARHHPRPRHAAAQQRRRARRPRARVAGAEVCPVHEGRRRRRTLEPISTFRDGDKCKCVNVLTPKTWPSSSYVPFIFNCWWTLKRWCLPSPTGFEARDTGIARGTQGVAGVQLVRRSADAAADGPQWHSHNCPILASVAYFKFSQVFIRLTNVKCWNSNDPLQFTFVTAGSMRLEVASEGAVDLGAGDSFVIPPDTRARYRDWAVGIRYDQTYF